MDESITNLRGIYGIEDEIEDLERKVVSNRKFDKINDQLNNPNSACVENKQNR